MEDFVASVESSGGLQGQLWMWTAVGCVFCAFTNFAYLTWQVIPLLGTKGLFPAMKQMQVRKQHYTLGRRLMHFPSTVLGSLGLGLSDNALRLYPVYGMSLCAAFVLTEVTAAERFGTICNSSSILQVVLLWAIWLHHVCVCDLVGMPFPWHSLLNESLLLFALGYSTMLGSGSSLLPYSPIGVAAIRLLAFRVMFGFGKFKFIGATWKDWKYIKAFFPGVPITTPFGLLAHRYLPDPVYSVAYFFFFLSEMVVPFFFFAPSAWYRVVAGLFIMKLMLGIQLTGNFGNFNLIVMILCIAVPLPVTGILPTNGSGDPSSCSSGSSGSSLGEPWWFALMASVASLALVLHMVAGTLLLPFNSWVSASWFGWPALTNAMPIIKIYCAVFEVLSQWRIAQPYGIFPPNTFPAQRQVNQFEGSADGKVWKPYRLLHQPAEEPQRRPSFIPGLHPWLDFFIFYQVGFFGFMQTCSYNSGVGANLECRLIDAMARNLLEGGDAADLFGLAPFPKTKPPTYIRCVQIEMVPAMEGPNWWKVMRGQIEIPACSLATMKHILPKSLIADPLTDTEPGLWNWRERVKGRKEQLAKFLPGAKNDVRALAVLRYLAAEQKKMSAECKEFIRAVTKKAGAKEGGGDFSLGDVLAYTDKQQNYIEVPALRQGLHGVAMLASDVLLTCGWPWSGENKERVAAMRKAGTGRAALGPGEPDVLPVSVVQLYLFCLWLLAEPSRLQGLEKETEKEMAAGESPRLEEVKQLLLQQVEGPSFAWYQINTPHDPMMVHDGLKLFVGMFPRTVRLEALLFRRMKTLGMIRNIAKSEEAGPDLVLPGYQLYWRSLFQKEVAWFPAHNPALADSCPSGLGGCWGPEILFAFEFNEKRCEFEYQGPVIDGKKTKKE